MACTYFAIEPFSDNEYDPTDQDSRTSFTDKDPSEPLRQQPTVPPVLRSPIASPVHVRIRSASMLNVYAAMYDQGRHSPIQPAQHPDRAVPPFTEVRLGVKQCRSSTVRKPTLRTAIPS
jgi:hypothetical protein